MKSIIIEVLLIITVIFILSLVKAIFDINFYGDKAVTLGLGLLIGETIYRLNFERKLKGEQ